jgi:hypothetical protein
MSAGIVTTCWSYLIAGALARIGEARQFKNSGNAIQLNAFRTD